MVKIYTKQGDGGFSSLGKEKIIKSDTYFDCLGEIDTVAAHIGLGIAYCENKIIKSYLFNIQRNLIKIASYIAGYTSDMDFLKIEINSLEEEIDKMDAKNTSLNKFILPGGNRFSSHVHLCRAVARSAERKIIKLMDEKNININENLLSYVNRLSDYFFVLARYSNNFGEDDLIA